VADPPQAVEHYLTVAKTARYILLGEPSAATRAVWIACHGYSQLAPSFVRRLARLASDTRVVAAPEALHRFYLDPVEIPAAERRVGATWMTREDREHDIADNAAYLDQLGADLLRQAPSARLSALGFSQGVATVARWAAGTRLPLDQLVFWGAPLPQDLEWVRAAPRFADLRVTLVAGNRDRVLPPPAFTEERARLEKHGVRCAALGFEGGHEIDAATLERIATNA